MFPAGQPEIGKSRRLTKMMFWALSHMVWETSYCMQPYTACGIETTTIPAIFALFCEKIACSPIPLAVLKPWKVTFSFICSAIACSPIPLAVLKQFCTVRLRHCTFRLHAALYRLRYWNWIPLPAVNRPMILHAALYRLRYWNSWPGDEISNSPRKLHAALYRLRYWNKRNKRIITEVSKLHAALYRLRYWNKYDETLFLL